MSLGGANLPSLEFKKQTKKKPKLNWVKYRTIIQSHSLDRNSYLTHVILSRLVCVGCTLVVLEITGREHSDSVVECLSPDRGVAGSNLNSVTALCPRARHINPCLVLVQPRKTCPNIT